MKIVGIHGIEHQYSGANLTGSQWLPALQDGLERAGVSLIKPDDFAMVFYGDLFRPSGMRGADIPPLSSNDVEKGWETELLMAWWHEAAILAKSNEKGADVLGEEPSIIGPDFQGRGITPAVVQEALMQLLKSRFFKFLGGKKLLIFALKQVRQYLYDQEMKKAILERVSEKVSSDTRVLIGHSLGSVIAYESLCAHPEWNVHTLVTLGSPIGIPKLIFDALTPKPDNGVGTWPNVKQWYNIADKGDIVALEKDLAPLFSSRVIDKYVYNGWESHSAERYLTTKETGQAIASGI